MRSQQCWKRAVLGRQLAAPIGNVLWWILLHTGAARFRRGFRRNLFRRQSYLRDECFGPGGLLGLEYPRSDWRQFGGFASIHANGRTESLDRQRRIGRRLVYLRCAIRRRRFLLGRQ